jgi:hypothetical protein
MKILGDYSKIFEEYDDSQGIYKVFKEYEDFSKISRFLKDMKIFFRILFLRFWRLFEDFGKF